MAKTITLKEFRDKDGRIWSEVPDLPRQLRHEPKVLLDRLFDSVMCERVVVEYLVGPLEEV